MTRNLMRPLGVVLAVAVVAVLGTALGARPFPITGAGGSSAAQTYHALERDVARVAAAGEQIITRGDICLRILRQNEPQAPELCRDFLEEAARWTDPLDDVAVRLVGLEREMDDRVLIAIGAGRAQALETMAALGSVVTRLHLQVTEADAAMVLHDPRGPLARSPSRPTNNPVPPQTAARDS